MCSKSSAKLQSENFTGKFIQQNHVSICTKQDNGRIKRFLDGLYVKNSRL
jgi:hypothetical protein